MIVQNNLNCNKLNTRLQIGMKNLIQNLKESHFAERCILIPDNFDRKVTFMFIDFRNNCTEIREHVNQIISLAENINLLKLKCAKMSEN